ncbi:hypothetical protein BJX99DRAFT_91733 [Aspergillus californicus]
MLREIIKELVAHGADLNTISDGRTILLEAVSVKQPGFSELAVQVLFELGASSNIQVEESRMMALHQAELDGNARAATQLLHSGTDVTLRVRQGKMAMQLAADHAFHRGLYLFLRRDAGLEINPNQIVL